MICDHDKHDWKHIALVGHRGPDRPGDYESVKWCSLCGSLHYTTQSDLGGHGSIYTPECHRKDKPQ